MVSFHSYSLTILFLFFLASITGLFALTGHTRCGFWRHHWDYTDSQFHFMNCVLISSFFIFSGFCCLVGCISRSHMLVTSLIIYWFIFFFAFQSNLWGSMVIWAQLHFFHVAFLYIILGTQWCGHDCAPLMWPLIGLGGISTRSYDNVSMIAHLSSDPLGSGGIILWGHMVMWT